MTSKQLLAYRRKLWAKVFPDRFCPKCHKDKGHASRILPCPHCTPRPPMKREAKRALDRASVKVRARYRSKSEPGVVHELKADKFGKFYSCSCKGYFHRKECRHMKAWMAKQREKNNG